VLRHTGRAASPEKTDPTQYPTQDGGWVNITRSGFNLTPARLRKLAEWLDSYGLAEDLLEEQYQSTAAIQANTGHIAEVLHKFFTHIPLEEAWHGGQQQGLPWGGVRSMDEIIDDLHLRDRGFFVEVEHPELGRRFIYPGAPAIYSASPWRISRRAPLIGEHNYEILCGELGLRQEELTLLAESRVI
ncbi:MAG: CoA transferase, partial [Candidatus Entotheonellia bacterium]